MIYTPMTRKAMALAYEAHHGQTDKSGVPYIFHPARVAACFTNEAVVCVAWLHDVLEDSDFTIDDLRLAGFGAVICDALLLLTHDKQVPYMDYIAAIERNPIAKAVKMADLRDNMDINRLPAVDGNTQTRLETYRAAYAYLCSDHNAA